MSIYTNILASLSARIWISVMSFAFVPLYIHFLGIEGYGLVSLFTAMLAVFALLDLGLSLTINREMARTGGNNAERARARSLLRTLEVIYGSVALLIGAILMLNASLIVRRWINVQSIPVDQAIAAVRLMGITAAFRWPVPLYLGALQGLRRQVSANAITALGATVAAGGAVLVLKFLQPTVTAFFIWQIVAWGLQLSVLRTVAWRALRMQGDRPRADFGSLRGIMGFSAGVTGIALLSVVLSQLDKLVLTRLLPLREFGYYSLTVSIAAVLPTAAVAVETAVFPALAHAIAVGDAGAERRLYHQASQMLALLLIPASVTLAVFAPELLAAYVGRADVVARSHVQLSILAAANLCLGAVVLPLSLQLAHGWTRLSLYKNVVAVLLYVPLLFVLIHRYGTIGAATAWLALCGGYVVFEVPIMHQRLLPGAQWRWYAIDMGLPLAITLSVQGAVRLLLPTGLAVLPTLAAIAAGGAAATLLSALSFPTSRAIVTRGVAQIGARLRPSSS